MTEAKFTKRQIGILRLADRKCGLSYRSAVKSGVHHVQKLRADGLLRLIDTGRDLGQFVFRTTQAGQAALSRARGE